MMDIEPLIIMGEYEKKFQTLHGSFVEWQYWSGSLDIEIW